MIFSGDQVDAKDGIHIKSLSVLIAILRLIVAMTNGHPFFGVVSNYVYVHPWGRIFWT